MDLEREEREFDNHIAVNLTSRRFNNRNTTQRRGESGRVYSTKRMVPLFASVGMAVSIEDTFTQGK